ncbi:hypothetical protein JZ751_005159 [Albula glossodonta]|uniref:Tudor domain-containing protein n=1 Tax=Albula glossodonta TaxID=121402 RepID=A0A8T2P5M3_9TELE|nr:hypothetical protein JZ751_005159 [Albula glossodonta]
MCSIPGLPTPGSNITILLTRVNLNPLCVLVELWGNFDQERKLDYQRMRREIQYPKEIFCESEGNPGDLCLVQIYETWYRARVVSRNGSNYSVFLIDEGRTLSATTRTLAWGHNDFFHLPPEVEFCVLANVLPLSPENRWSPMALEFLKSLCGRTVNGCVQDVLVPHRTFLLDIPCISKQMYEMGFAKKLSIEKFKLFVSRSLQSLSGAVVTETQISSIKHEPVEVHSQVEKRQCYMYPELQTETVETVIVTEVTNPLRIFCQLKVFSQELNKLTEQITQHFEGRLRTGKMRRESLGSPCASRGSDGKWYRSVLQQVLPSNNIVEVLHVDYGKKDFVQLENIRPLAAEFLRMPVVTYVCSLHGIIDKGVGWTPTQIDYLKSLLLHRTVIAKFEYQSLSEGVQYVTLYGDENVNINNLFGMKEKCLLESEKSCEAYAVRRTVGSQKLQETTGNETQRIFPRHRSLMKENQATPAPEGLPLNSTHLAVVQFVENPSEFWIQTQRYAHEFDKLMNSISDLYDNSATTTGLVKKPTVGLFCAARSQDNAFYRATVCEVMGKQAKVYFVDYGNTEVVDWYNIRILPEQYQGLPALALKCCLAGIRPKDEQWSQSASTFFMKVTDDKVLDVFISDKSEGKYLVQLTDTSSCGERDIGKMLCSAGFAETDFKKPISRHMKTSLILSAVQASGGKSPDMEKIKASGAQSLTCISTMTETRSVFKEHLFPIGSSVDVNVSYIESPNDFWCQIVQNAGSLNLLMQDIQNYYADSEFQQSVEAACVARHPDNRMWYRALIIQKYTSSYVNVLFIDYGQTQKVSIQDLRPINPTFLKLKGQAFRCSLYNLIHPVGHSALEWSDAAISEFQNFVDSAASSHVDLKCTIYAIMYDSQKVVFNVVDLETPFQSVCSLLVQKGLADRAPPKKVPLPPFRLDTYYYSTHNIKTGGEEEIYVTNVKSVNLFYCQLGRNSDLVDELAEKVNFLCRQLQCIHCPQTFGTVCFAKYTDGLWYRGQIKSTHPDIQVQFVDYGDTLAVDKSDLLPIPIEASEIMSVPVQAVECGLSDIPADVSSEVNSWFANCATDHSFRALVVAKEPCGKLMVELYSGKAQVNSKIKEHFHIEAHRREKVSYEQPNIRSQYLKGPSIKHTEHFKASDEHKLAPKRVENNGKNVNVKSAFKTSDTSLRQMQGDVKQFSHVEIQWEPTEVNLRTCENVQQQQILQSNSGATVKKAQDECGEYSQAFSKIKEQSFPKLQDLPSKSIKPGMLSEVFVSHCNTPSSFFVQLTDEENEIFSVVEKLNEDLAVKHVDIKELQPGDLVKAEFADDCSWYRATVVEKTENNTVDVEFIDFGNRAIVSSSKIGRLDKQFLEHPRYSIPCLLSGVSSVSKDKCNKEVVVKFQKAVGENAEKKLVCNFIRKTGYVWEVSLADQNVMLSDTIFDSVPAVSPDVLVSEKPQSPKMENTFPENSKNKAKIDVTSAGFKTADLSERQTFEVYVTSVVGPDYFWCQYAHSEKLQMVSELVGEMGKSEVQEVTWVDSLCPGSPCLALFKDDEQWYRAEVTAKTEKDFSVLFIDYGNESEVEQHAVKPVPPLLLETPPQAFLCLLDEFDSSLGTWDESAVDRFFDLTTDEVLKVTILKVKNVKDRKTPQYQVKVVCKDQVLNDIMKDYWKQSAPLASSEFDENKQPSTTMIASCEITSEEANELNLAGQNIYTDVLPETDFENTTDFVSDVPQCFGRKIKELELLHSEDPEQLGCPGHILPLETTGIKDEDLKLVCASELVADFHDHESTLGNEEKDERKEISKEGNEMRLTVSEDPVDNTLCSCDHMEGSAETSLILGGTDSNSLTTHLIGTSKDMPSFTLEIQEESTKCVSEGTDTTELSVFPEELPHVNTVCLAMCKENCKTEACNSEPLKDFEEPFQNRRASVKEQACSLDEMDPLLYKVDESFDELVLHEDPCRDVHTDNDIYEEVFKQCTGLVLKDMGPVPLFSNEIANKEIREEDRISRTEPEFDKLKMTEKEHHVGTDCVVWSYAHSSWCNGRIVKISEDCATVQDEMQQPTICPAAGDSLEEQISCVTHLTLKIEDISDDEVIFVKEMCLPRQRAQELEASEEEEPKNLSE